MLLDNSYLDFIFVPTHMLARRQGLRFIFLSDLRTQNRYVDEADSLFGARLDVEGFVSKCVNARAAKHKSITGILGAIHESSDRLVGCIVFYLPRNINEIEMFASSLQGVGNCLFSATQEVMLQLGINRCTLNAKTDAIPFYQSFGLYQVLDDDGDDWFENYKLFLAYFNQHYKYSRGSTAIDHKPIDKLPSKYRIIGRSPFIDFWMIVDEDHPEVTIHI